MVSKIHIANHGDIGCRTIGGLRYGAIAALAVLALCFADAASACSVLTPAGQRREERRQQLYLERHADRVVVGTFREDPGGRQDDDFVLWGVIEVERRARVDRYRVRISGEINCGFPFYYLHDGDHGRFFLKRDEHSDGDDRADGLIDNYSYVHFESLEQSS